MPAPLFISNGTFELHLLPEIGGKVSQIRHLPSGRSLLIAAQVPYRQIPLGEQWVNFDTSGMDDCFPNVDEGPYPLEPWKSMPLPQMGEWVYGSWSVAAADKQEITLERIGNVLPYRARKQVGFAGDDGIRLEYRVENRDEHPFRYMWAAHPLLAIDEIYRLRLPGGTMEFVTFPPDLMSRRWPCYGGLDLSREWVPNGTTLKISIRGLRDGWCELELTGLTIRFEFDLAKTPFLGIWFNNFGFPTGRAPFRCIAVEPCTSPSDVLHTLDSSQYPVIQPRETAEWAVTVRVRST